MFLASQPNTAVVSGFAPQQQAQRRPSQGLNFGGIGDFMASQQRMGTPFENQLIKDAASGFGSAVGGAMGQISGQLNANADRVQQNREQTNQWAQANNVLPPSMVESQLAGAGNPLQMYLNLNKQFQQGRAQAGVDAQQTQDRYAKSRFGQFFPQQQQQADLMANLFSRIMGGGGGGGFTTNFGASGSY